MTNVESSVKARDFLIKLHILCESYNVDLQLDIDDFDRGYDMEYLIGTVEDTPITYLCAGKGVEQPSMHLKPDKIRINGPKIRLSK